MGLLVFGFMACKNDIDPELQARTNDLSMRLKENWEVLNLRDSIIRSRQHWVDVELAFWTSRNDSLNDQELAMKLTDLRGFRRIFELYFTFKPGFMLRNQSLETGLGMLTTQWPEQDRTKQFQEIARFETLVYSFSDSVQHYIAPVLETELAFHHVEKLLGEKRKGIKPVR